MEQKGGEQKPVLQPDKFDDIFLFPSALDTFSDILTDVETLPQPQVVNTDQRHQSSQEGQNPRVKLKRKLEYNEDGELILPNEKPKESRGFYAWPTERFYRTPANPPSSTSALQQDNNDQSVDPTTQPLKTGPFESQQPTRINYAIRNLLAVRRTYLPLDVQSEYSQELQQKRFNRLFICADQFSKVYIIILFIQNILFKKFRKRRTVLYLGNNVKDFSTFPLLFHTIFYQNVSYNVRRKKVGVMTSRRQNWHNVSVHDIVMSYPHIFYSALISGYVDLDMFSVVIFDDVVYADKYNFYNMIMRKYYYRMKNNEVRYNFNQMPKIIGVTMMDMLVKAVVGGKYNLDVGFPGDGLVPRWQVGMILKKVMTLCKNTDSRVRMCDKRCGDIKKLIFDPNDNFRRIEVRFGNETGKMYEIVRTCLRNIRVLLSSETQTYYSRLTIKLLMCVESLENGSNYRYMFLKKKMKLLDEYLRGGDVTDEEQQEQKSMDMLNEQKKSFGGAKQQPKNKKKRKRKKLRFFDKSILVMFRCIQMLENGSPKDCCATLIEFYQRNLRDLITFKNLGINLRDLYFLNTVLMNQKHCDFHLKLMQLISEDLKKDKTVKHLIFVNQNEREGHLKRVLIQNKFSKVFTLREYRQLLAARKEQTLIETEEVDGGKVQVQMEKDEDEGGEIVISNSLFLKSRFMKTFGFVWITPSLSSYDHGILFQPLLSKIQFRRLEINCQLPEREKEIKQSQNMLREKLKLLEKYFTDGAETAGNGYFRTEYINRKLWDTLSANAGDGKDSANNEQLKFVMSDPLEMRKCLLYNIKELFGSKPKIEIHKSTSEESGTTRFLGAIRIYLRKDNEELVFMGSDYFKDLESAKLDVEHSFLRKLSQVGIILYPSSGLLKSKKGKKGFVYLFPDEQLKRFCEERNFSWKYKYGVVKKGVSAAFFVCVCTILDIGLSARSHFHVSKKAARREVAKKIIEKISENRVV